MALTMGLTSCTKEDDLYIPEGTAEVTITTDDAEFTVSNHVNWVNYATAVAQHLAADSRSLHNAWAVDYKAQGPFAETFRQHSGNGYSSAVDCVEQIIEGCADIANEVGSSKIGEPRDLWEKGSYTEAVYAVESWYSYHSIDDYSNNILSIRNAFRGNRGGMGNTRNAEHSLAAYLEAHNPTLYTTVSARIAAAYNAIQGMNAPFRSHIGNTSVVVAMEACDALEKTLSNELKPYIINLPESEDAMLDLIVDNYVEQVVLPTYAELAQRNDLLYSAVAALAKTPSTANFKAAAEAWLAAREPWETSEAFLFGPVAELGLDPNMDSWPLDADAIKNILTSGDFSGMEWSGEYDEENSGIEAAQNVRGYHTLEFLLFKNGQPREGLE